MKTMSKEKIYLHLRIYKGAQILKNEEGQIITPSQLFKIQIGTLEFEKVVKTLPVTGYGIAKVEKVVNENGEARELPATIQSFLDSVFSKPKTFKVESQDESDKDRQIAELKAKLEALTLNDGKVLSLETSEETTPQNNNLNEKTVAELSDLYKSLSGIPAPKGLKKEDLIEAINTIQNTEV